MTEEQIELARRLIAHPRWEWPAFIRVDWTDIDEVAYPIPDLTNAATGGVLLEMVVEAAGIEGRDLHAAPDTDEGWYVCLPCLWDGYDENSMNFLGATLAESCARALLALWGDE